jgi:hypothetical protein
MTHDTPTSFQNPQKKNLKCDYCHKEGQTIKHCYRKKNRDRKKVKIIIWFVLL